MAELVMSLHAISSSVYKALNPKDDNALYYLTDTREIYKGEISYSESTIVLPDFPTSSIAKNKLYINKSTMEGKVYDGTNWISVMRPVSTVLDTTTDYDDMLITGAGIKVYIDNSISDIIAAGGVTAGTIQASEEIRVIGVDQGVYKDGDVIPKNESILTILKNMLQKTVPPTYRTPSCRINISGSSIEAGASISPTFTTIFTQNDAGSVTNYSVGRTIDGVTTPVLESPTIISYTQESIPVGDTGLSFVSTVSYADGPIKNDNMGNPSPNGQIKAGSVSATMKYTTFRKSFYGSEPGKSAVCATSDDVRALPIATPGALVIGTECIKINCVKGDTRVTIAYPATLPDISIIKAAGLGMNVISAFTKSTVLVTGVDSYNPIEYKVYSYVPDIPFPADDIYLITI